MSDTATCTCCARQFVRLPNGTLPGHGRPRCVGSHTLPVEGPRLGVLLDPKPTKTCVGHGGDEHRVRVTTELYDGLCRACVVAEVNEYLALALTDGGLLELPPAWVQVLLDVDSPAGERG